MPRRRPMHSPSPVPAPPGTQLRGDRDRDSDDGTPIYIGVKREMDSDHKPVTITKRTKKTKSEVKPKASGSGSTLEDVKPKRGPKKPGRKPGVSYDSKKWSGSELEALFFAGHGSNGSVPSARSMTPSKVAARPSAQRVIPTIIKALRDTKDGQ